jgi:hypothetical protein
LEYGATSDEARITRIVYYGFEPFFMFSRIAEWTRDTIGALETLSSNAISQSAVLYQAKI